VGVWGVRGRACIIEQVPCAFFALCSFFGRLSWWVGVACVRVLPRGGSCRSEWMECSSTAAAAAWWWFTLGEGVGVVRGKEERVRRVVWVEGPAAPLCRGWPLPLASHLRKGRTKTASLVFQGTHSRPAHKTPCPHTTPRPPTRCHRHTLAAPTLRGGDGGRPGGWGRRKSARPRARRHIPRALNAARAPREGHASCERGAFPPHRGSALLQRRARTACRATSGGRRGWRSGRSRRPWRPIRGARAPRAVASKEQLNLRCRQAEFFSERPPSAKPLKQPSARPIPLAVPAQAPRVLLRAVCAACGGRDGRKKHSSKAPRIWLPVSRPAALSLSLSIHSPHKHSLPHAPRQP
jgi:hypothetical protein